MHPCKCAFRKIYGIGGLTLLTPKTYNLTTQLNINLILKSTKISQRSLKG